MAPKVNSIGIQIRRYRAAKGWSMEELAEATGLSKQSVWLIETGQSQPRRKNLARIAKALEVDVTDLTRPPPPEENAPGLQAMLDQGLADPPPTEEEVAELREVPFRGEPDAVSYLYALQAIRRANARASRAERVGEKDDPDSEPNGTWHDGR